MLLSTNLIRLSEKSLEVGIQIREFDEAEIMHVISRRDCFDASKSWVIRAPREDHVSIEPGALGRRLGK
jgi:hypothetical protein